MDSTVWPWLRVRAFAAVALLGVLTACSGDSSPTGPSATTIPTAPSLVASPIVHAVGLYWPCVANATGYIVLRDGTEMVRVTACTYTDPGLTYGTHYCYTVRAFSPAGTSSDSNQVCANPGPDYTGHWTGRTSQDWQVWFKASGGDQGSLTDIDYVIEAAAYVSNRLCMPIFLVRWQSTPIEKAAFTKTTLSSDGLTELVFAGAFTSETEASGTISMRVTSGMCAGLSKSVTWTAVRDPSTP
jgi:hypothetical protein